MAVSYATDIRPLFRPIDISRMAFFCDLASYDDVKTNAPHTASEHRRTLVRGQHRPVREMDRRGLPALARASD